jgi:cell wall-associated NlpC family hydrolase
MAAGDINKFLGVIRNIESRGKYDARGPVIKSGMYKGQRAMGAYQIMPGNWNAWAKEAGVPGANWRDPKMQDIVARHKMLSLYRKHGRWDYVAGEWFAGAGGLKKLIENRGDPSDGLTSLSKYMNMVRQGMGAAGATAATSTSPAASQLLGDTGGGTQGGTTPPPTIPNPYANMLQTSTYTPYSTIDPQDLGRTSLPFEEEGDTGQVQPNQPSSADLFESMLTAVSRKMMTQSQQNMQAGEPAGNDDPAVLPDPIAATTEEITLADTPSTLTEGAGDDPFIRETNVAGALADLSTITAGTGLAESVEGVDDEAAGTLPPTMSDADRARMMEAIQAGTYSPSSNPQGILAIGEQFIGTPYKWGGTTPQGGFDCSGLVQYVFKQAGINLPRVSADQAKAGTAVSSLEEARPGDLVFWRGQGGRPNHIGIYAGDGKMLEAPRTGLNVRYRDITKTPHAIRRVL